MKEIRDTKYIYRNEFDKARFQHDITYGDFKDLPRRTASDKVLKDKAINVAEILKYDGYQRGLTFMVYRFFDKKSTSLADESTKGSGVAMLQNEQLPEELNKPVVLKNFKKEEFILLLKTIFGVLI